MKQLQELQLSQSCTIHISSLQVITSIGSHYLYVILNIINQICSHLGSANTGRRLVHGTCLLVRYSALYERNCWSFGHKLTPDRILYSEDMLAGTQPRINWSIRLFRVLSIGHDSTQIISPSLERETINI